MAAEAGKPKDAMRDEGLERGVAGLTKEKIRRVIRRVIDSETGARLQAYVDTCVHCGLCFEACHFFLSRDRDPRYSPVGKVKQTLWEMLRRDGNVSPGFIRMMCANFVEMEPNREHSYCRGAGGGVINCGPPYKKGRMESTRVKAEQISAAKVKGAKVVITPCHNCHSGMGPTVPSQASSRLRIAQDPRNRHQRHRRRPRRQRRGGVRQKTV